MNGPCIFEHVCAFFPRTRLLFNWICVVMDMLLHLCPIFARVDGQRIKYLLHTRWSQKPVLAAFAIVTE